MAFVGIRELSRDTSRVIREFEESGEPLIVTREGKPIGALMPVTEGQVQDIVMATAPEFRPGPRVAGELPESQSLEEYAAEQGVYIDEPAALATDEAPAFEESNEIASENGDLSELVASAIESEMRPVLTTLKEPYAAWVITTARKALVPLNSEALGGIKGPPLGPGEIRCVADLTAGLYGQEFRKHLESTLWEEPTLEGVQEAGESAARTVRFFNQSVTRDPELSFGAFLAAFRGLASVREPEVEVGDGEENAEAEADAVG